MFDGIWVISYDFDRADDSVKHKFYTLPVVRTIEGEQTNTSSDEQKWLNNINQKKTAVETFQNLLRPLHTRDFLLMYFVSFSFSGKTEDLYNRSHPERAPTLKLCNLSGPFKPKKQIKAVETYMEMYKRMQHRNNYIEEHDIAKTLLNMQHFHDSYFVPDGEEYNNGRVNQVCTFSVKENMETYQELTAKTNYIKQSIIDKSFYDNEEKVKYCTGLPCHMALMNQIDFVCKYISTSRGPDVGKFEKLIMTLMRLKLNLSLQDIAYIFPVSTSTVSRTFLTVIHVLHCRLRPVFFWPEMKELQLTMPLEFRKYFGGKVAVIIDCFEIFIQRPKSLMPRAQTWSLYKHNKTIQFIIEWWGRASDKYITEHCGFISKLLLGDIMLADRLFNISDSIGIIIAHLQIHVECVIGLVRNKYIMLQGKLPIDFLMNDKGETPVADTIVSVACCLTTMCEYVVPFD
ncbi:hypothetical protein ACJMK2_005856 [Sinanodonta woodiana]|uniref:Uncharacterized protein n=1 Tax=Sinanodonta woodiana TaxID=1069815 RepID=A0ABD3VS42_SINWO